MDYHNSGWRVSIYSVLLGRWPHRGVNPPFVRYYFSSSWETSHLPHQTELVGAPVSSPVTRSCSRLHGTSSIRPDIKLCTYCLDRHTTVLIHEILYLANQLRCIDFLTPPTPLIIPHRLPAFLKSLIPLKNWYSIHWRCSKSSLKLSIRSCGIFTSLKQNFIAYRSSKVSRVYSNCCCSCWFESEIIKIGQSSHKMYSNNSEFSRVYNNFKYLYKKVRKLLNAPRIYIYWGSVICVFIG